MKTLRRELLKGAFPTESVKIGRILNDNVMKICFLLADITHTGGIERVTSNLAIQLLSEIENLEVDIVSQCKSGNELWYTFEGCNIHYLNNHNYDAKPHSLKRMIKMLWNIMRIRRFFKSHHYDYIISQAMPNTIILFLAGINLKNVLAVEHVKYN